MRVTFLSNYMNHHQLPLCQNLHQLLGENFCFIALSEVSEDRKKLGYKDIKREHPFIRTLVDGNISESEIWKKCLESDILLVGSAPDLWFQERLKQRKVTIKYSERYFRTGWTLRYFLPDSLSAWKHLVRYQRYPLYFLCASAYTAKDVNRFADYKNRTFKWGYFTSVRRYDDPMRLIAQKRSNSIIWVARFLELKHPEAALEVAERLKREGIDFTLEMLGDGPLLEQTKAQAKAMGLENVVSLPGAVSPETVRTKMEQSQIFLFTSDQNEGWGAVLNEAMSSCCAVVANRAIGAAPFLIQDQHNGFMYDSQEELYQRVKELIMQPLLRQTLSSAAYKTMVELWSPEIAAGRLLQLCDALLNKEPLDLFEEGPGSRA